MEPCRAAPCRKQRGRWGIGRPADDPAKPLAHPPFHPSAIELWDRLSSTTRLGDFMFQAFPYLKLGIPQRNPTPACISQRNIICWRQAISGLEARISEAGSVDVLDPRDPLQMGFLKAVAPIAEMIGFQFPQRLTQILFQR